LIAVDTNILVYAHRPECPSHGRAFAVLRELAASTTSWGVPLHCFVEFAAVVTNPRIWMDLDGFRMGGERGGEACACHADVAGGHGRVERSRPRFGHRIGSPR
jgi:hypothetical protein